MPHLPTPDWSNFLNSDLPASNPVRLRAALSGKSILITGAGGWIGSALATALLAFNPRQIVLLESAEANLHEAYSALSERPGPGVTPILGSVGDPSLLRDLFQQFRPHLIFHAAAFKHVPLMEQNPIAVVQNNSIGTYALAQAASEFPVEQLILISTDKAADPVSIMGASKRVAELVLLAGIAGSAQQKVVRLGNVLGSPGSVVPLF